MNSGIRSVVLWFLFVLCSPSVFGGTNGFIIPPFRSEAGAQFAGWERLSWAVGTNNLPDLADSTTNAVLLQTDPGAILTGSGNIYSVEGTNRFQVIYAGGSSVSAVVLQARTLGTELDYDSVQLVFESGGTNVFLSASRTELDRSSAQGASVSSKWEWNLGGFSVSTFTIEFVASGSSLSFDAATLDVRHNSIRLVSVPTDFDRWMYPFNSTPGTRPSGSVFGTLGTDSGVDTRHGQFVVGWNTSNAVPAGIGATNYLVRKARLTMTINRDLAWTYDPTFDTFETYLSTNDVRRLEDTDAGRPVELFGAGFRNGYDATTFPENGPFSSGEGLIGTRNIFTAGYDTNGTLIDVSNNVGKLDEDAFEVHPFAVGTAADLTPGDLAPTGTKIVFDLDLDDPLIHSFLQNGLNTGSLRFAVSSLIEGAFQNGAPNYPQFYTRDNALAAPDEIPLLDLEVELVRTETPAETALLVARTQDGKVRVSWPVPAGGSYALEASSTLTGAWTAVEQSAQIENGAVTIELNAASPMQFFRLKVNP